MQSRAGPDILSFVSWVPPFASWVVVVHLSRFSSGSYLAKVRKLYFQIVVLMMVKDSRRRKLEEARAIAKTWKEARKL